MIVLNAHSQQQGRRTLPMKAAVYGLAAGLLSALSAVNAAPPSLPAPAPAAATAPQALPAKAAVAAITSIDFKRGDGGSGKLILQFDKDGAMPDMRASDAGIAAGLRHRRAGQRFGQPRVRSDSRARSPPGTCRPTPA